MNPIGNMKFIVIIYSAIAMLNMVVGAAPLTTIDQQNNAPATGTNGGALFGQSFTPTLTRIDAIEFLMGGFSETVIVEILDGVMGFDGLGAPVIGTSNPVLVNTPGVHQIIHFDFPLAVLLVPGQTYVARLFAASGIRGVSHSENFYAGGQFLAQGYAPGSYTSERDMIFREGLSVPEPTTAWLIALGFGCVFAFTKFGATRRS